MAATVTMTIAGCSDQLNTTQPNEAQPDQVSTASVTSTPSAVDRAAWRLPLDDYIETPVDGAIANYLELRLRERCILTTSVANEWEPLPTAALAEFTPPETESPSGLNILTTETAQRWGYLRDIVPPQEYSDAMSARNSEQLSAPVQAASQGCLDQVRAEHPIPVEGTNFASSLANTSLNQALADTAVIEAAERWRECMLPLGLPDLPQDPYGDDGGMPTASQIQRFPELDDPFTADPHPSVDQVREAVADAECRETSGYSDALYTALWNYQSVALADSSNADQLVRDHTAVTTHLAGLHEAYDPTTTP